MVDNRVQLSVNSNPSALNKFGKWDLLIFAGKLDLATILFMKGSVMRFISTSLHYFEVGRQREEV